MSIEAQNNAARTHEEDLLACSSYVETDAGATGQQNADVLGRLIVGAHARLDESHEHIGKLDARLTAMLAAVQIVERVERELRERLERIGDSLENVVSERLLTLRQRVEIVEKDLQTSNPERLPEGVTRTLEQRITRLEQGVDGLGS